MVYCVTIAFVLIEDLLVGVLVGMATEFAIHLWRRAPLGLSLFRPKVQTEDLPDGTCRLSVRDSAIFSNWLPLRATLLRMGLERNCSVALDFEHRGLKFELVGLDSHRPVSAHPFAARLAPQPEAAAAG